MNEVRNVEVFINRRLLDQARDYLQALFYDDSYKNMSDGEIVHLFFLKEFYALQDSWRKDERINSGGLPPESHSWSSGVSKCSS